MSTQPAQPPSDTAGPAPATVRYAGVVVLVQAAGLLGTAVALVVLAMVHSSQRLWAALAIVGFAVLGAAVFYFCGRGLLALRPSARSPIVLLELLALPVGYSLGIQAGRPLIGLPVLLSAVAVLALLATPSAREALNRPI
ncbi:MAG TPA: hypothetical protein VMB79_09905 [Jatrophihabitans sp.]|nr:hypothetical protein [Jatrophihabitans sp.]